MIIEVLPYAQRFMWHKESDKLSSQSQSNRPLALPGTDSSLKAQTDKVERHQIIGKVLSLFRCEVVQNLDIVYSLRPQITARNNTDVGKFVLFASFALFACQCLMLNNSIRSRRKLSLRAARPLLKQDIHL